ncbi:hypothetical protein [Paeniglutamicibacter terrestris]|uniref:DUF3188 domain-containing protein n=1 Tax=Paeniglutamicibacter terrestris TaxID=2723403 RepID=A0ABX1G3P6_9MICC|nr:hypothetical protein [Paeniglutamicibacter terrestris]ASN38663.1 hypothetical protein CGQ24_06360 [Arthrobacter sp. 7749]NKG20231.1 hypothetical protein [Paeniglutamicibacter terrestris]
MTNTPWEASSGLYKKLTFSAMGVEAIGIVMAIIGAGTQNTALLYTAMVVIGIGLLGHLGGMAVRARDARTWRVAQGLVKPRAPKRGKSASKDTL